MSRCHAAIEWVPTASGEVSSDQVPLAPATVVPRTVLPSKTVTVARGSAVPEMVGVATVGSASVALTFAGASGGSLSAFITASAGVLLASVTPPFVEMRLPPSNVLSTTATSSGWIKMPPP